MKDKKSVRKQFQGNDEKYTQQRNATYNPGSPKKKKIILLLRQFNKDKI